jgi:hypothetical protein
VVAETIYVSTLVDLRSTLSDSECVPYNFIRQFALSASLSWWFVLSLNYWLSVSNPFKRPDLRCVRTARARRLVARSGLRVTLPPPPFCNRRNMQFHVAVWSLALATSFVAAANTEFRHEFELCYTKKAGTWAALLC